jgi:hypothetical protein
VYDPGKTKWKVPRKAVLVEFQYKICRGSHFIFVIFSPYHLFESHPASLVGDVGREEAKLMYIVVLVGPGLEVVVVCPPDVRVIPIGILSLDLASGCRWCSSSLCSNGWSRWQKVALPLPPLQQSLVEI